MTINTDFAIDKWKTVCVTGHRKITTPINKERLKEIFSKFIENGINTFLVGMALGFDTICFHVLEELREKEQIKIIACIPCPEQDKFFSECQKKEYGRMIDVADEKIVLSEKYTSYCMIKRNKFIVDNSCAVVAYLTEDKGGTYSTVKYAQEKNLQVIIL